MEPRLAQELSVAQMAREKVLPNLGIATASFIQTSLGVLVLGLSRVSLIGLPKTLLLVLR